MKEMRRHIPSRGRGLSPDGGFHFTKWTGFPGCLELLLCPAGGKGPGNLMVGQGFKEAKSANQP